MGLLRKGDDTQRTLSADIAWLAKCCALIYLGAVLLAAIVKLTILADDATGWLEIILGPFSTVVFCFLFGSLCYWGGRRRTV